jgi:hypothetical protein
MDGLRPLTKHPFLRKVTRFTIRHHSASLGARASRPPSGQDARAPGGNAYRYSKFRTSIF